MIVPFENGEEEFDIDVEINDYEPFEPMTRHNPGSIETVSVYHIATIADTGVKFCLLDDAEEIVADYILNRRTIK